MQALGRAGGRDVPAARGCSLDSSKQTNHLQCEAASGWIKSFLPRLGGGNTRFFGFGAFTFFLGGFFDIRATSLAANSTTAPRAAGDTLCALH